MAMTNVFVETNWVVASVAPENYRMPAALRLLERAGAGEIMLHVPSVCLTEARETVRRRYKPRAEADAFRAFVRWARGAEKVTEQEAQIGRKIVDMFEQRVSAGLAAIDEEIESVRSSRGVEVFPMSDAMLHRAVELGASDLYLEPFDQAILAAVLVHGREIGESCAEPVIFSVLDRNLQPWDKAGSAKQPLTSFYDEAKIWVCGDFGLDSPARPEGWGGARVDRT